MPAKESGYSPDVDGRRVPKPSYVKELQRRERAEHERTHWKARFLHHYASCGNITKACRQAKIDPQLFYKERRNDPDFADAFAIAHRAATDKALEAVWEIGVAGTREPIVWQGEIVAYVRRKDWKAARFILETFDPGTYSQKERIARLGIQSNEELQQRREQMLEAVNERMKTFGGPKEIEATVVENDGEGE